MWGIELRWGDLGSCEMGWSKDEAKVGAGGKGLVG